MMGRPKKVRTAEEQLAYRDKIKADHAKYEAHKQKEKERRRTRKAEKKIKAIGDMTEREQRAKRKYWRDDNTKRSERAAAAAANVTSLPHHQDIGPNEDSQQAPGGSNDLGRASRQKTRGRGVMSRNKTAAYRQIAVLGIELENAQKKIRMFKKRLHRLQANYNDGDDGFAGLTPRTKARATVRRGKHNIRRQ